jgi:hypothetical protein
MLSFFIRLGIPNRLLPSHFSTRPCMMFSPVQCMPHDSPPNFYRSDHPSKVWRGIQSMKGLIKQSFLPSNYVFSAGSEWPPEHPAHRHAQPVFLPREIQSFAPIQQYEIELVLYIVIFMFLRKQTAVGTILNRMETITYLKINFKIFKWKSSFSFKSFLQAVSIPKRLTMGLRSIFRHESKYKFYIQLCSVPNERVFTFDTQNSLGQRDFSEIISFGMLWWRWIDGGVTAQESGANLEGNPWVYKGRCMFGWW